MSQELTKFLPVKDTTTTINNTPYVNGQVLFETDEKHRLFVDGNNQRHTLIDYNESLSDFNVFASQSNNSGYNALELIDGDDDSTYVEIPHTRYSNGNTSKTIITENADMTFEIPCSANTDWANVSMFIEPYLVSDGGVITSSGSIIKGFCCNINPTSITYVNNGNIHKIVIHYPNFNSHIYGIEIPVGGYITFTCYVRTQSNYGGTNFWS